MLYYQKGDYNMIEMITNPLFTFALGVLYTGAVIAWLRHVPGDKAGVRALQNVFETKQKEYYNMVRLDSI